MADFVAAPAISRAYPRLATLTSEDIAQAERCGYIADNTDVTGTIPWSCSDALKYTSEMTVHGNDLRAWRGKLYLIWFCYVFENLKVIRRPLFAIEELFLHFQSNLIDDLAQMFAGCGAWDETITPEDWVRIHPVLQKYHARAVGLLAHAPPSKAIDAPETITLWRPVGEGELRLIEASGWRRFPPRLVDQPIFYPVLSEAYAVQIARDWNAPRGGGWVTRFEVRRSFLGAYLVQKAGGRMHLEYWIPASDLDALNEAIVGEIKVTAEFR